MNWLKVNTPLGEIEEGGGAAAAVDDDEEDEEEKKQCKGATQGISLSGVSIRNHLANRQVS